MKNSWTGGEVASVASEETAENLALSVHRCEAGAFERLIQRFERPLFNYAHGILDDAFDAQEVVQDAMMRAHRALTRQYDEARVAALTLRPWLFRTVRNLCLNKRRSKKSAPSPNASAAGSARRRHASPGGGAGAGAAAFTAGPRDARPPPAPPRPPSARCRDGRRPRARR